MNLADMQALVAVVETGSLAHAAIKLNLTQPAVTRRIQRLEETLGARLLDREVKPARPTRDGQAAYAECVRVLNAADGLKGVLGAAPSAERTLRMGVSLGATDLILPALLPAPEGVGRIAVEAARSVSLEQAVAERRLDAALVLRDGRSEGGGRGMKVSHLPVRVVAPAAAKLPRRVALADLRGRRWVLCPDGCGYRRALEHGLYGAAQPLDIAAAIWGFSQQAQLVAAGIGLGLLPLRIIEQDQKHALQVLDVSDFSATLDLSLVRPAGEDRLDARLEAICLRLLQFLGSGPAAA